MSVQDDDDAASDAMSNTYKSATKKKEISEQYSDTPRGGRKNENKKADSSASKVHNETPIIDRKAYDYMS